MSTTRNAFGAIRSLVALAAVVTTFASVEARAEEAPLASPPGPSFPRLTGGVRLGLGAVVVPGSSGPAASLSARVGARLSPALAVYGEAGGAPAFRGGQSASGYGSGAVVMVLAPYGSLLLGVRPVPSFEITVGPTFAALYPFPSGAPRSPLRAGGTLRALLLAKKAHRPGGVGFYFAPSLDAMVLAGDTNGATVYLGLSPLAFEWM